MPHHVILGGGLAALSAIEAIREHDGTGSRISLISQQPPPVDNAYFARLNVDRYIGQPASRINPRANTVTIKGGQMLPFDDLLIATAASPLMPAIPGIDGPGVHRVETATQLEAVRQSAGELDAPDVVLIGASLNGINLWNGMQEFGWQAKIVEATECILADMIDDYSATVLKSWLSRQGVVLHLGSAVQEIRTHEGKPRVMLANGLTLDADLVVVAPIHRPSLGLARAAGIATDQGVLVNDRMQTNFPHVYAAGEVAQGPNRYGGPPVVHPMPGTAREHGQVAGASMAGSDARYAGSVWFQTLTCCGLFCASVGRWNDPSAERMITETCTCDAKNPPTSRQLFWHGDSFMGASFVGPRVELEEDAIAIYDLLRAHEPLGEWKKHLDEPGFDFPRVGLPRFLSRFEPPGETL